MFEVLLIRHGIPLCDHHTRIRGCDFAGWVAAYEKAPVDRGIPPPPELQARLATVPCIVTSTLRRAIESASLAGSGRLAASHALFDEASIPTSIPFRLTLSPGQWDVLARVAWILGWADGRESFRDARVRARRAAARMVALAREHGTVALIGHGMLNTLMSRALRRSGWTGSGSPREYWGSLALRKSTASFALECGC
jgi:broad specificity phosphatase PhoE